MRRWPATAWLALSSLALPALAPAAEEGAAQTETEIVERILRLREEMEKLLRQLPPERREEVARRLRETAAAEPAAPPAAVPSADPSAAPAPSGTPAPAPSETPAAVDAPAPGADSAAEGDASVKTRAPVTPPPRRVRRQRTVCNTLEIFDSNADGTVNAQDRYWRYLYLWLDKNSNGAIDKREILSPFDQKVRGIDVDLETFSTVKSGLGEIRVGDAILLDLRGNGFDSERSRDDAVLLVDAGALKRGDGPKLFSSAGEELSGVEPFKKGFRVQVADAPAVRLNCP